MEKSQPGGWLSSCLVSRSEHNRCSASSVTDCHARQQ